jgi:2-methylcitrate dehydratase PrpD
MIKRSKDRGFTRRELLKTAGVALATAVPAARLEAQAAATGPVMTALSTYMSGAAGRDLPVDIVEHAKHHILDTIAAMMSGSELPPGQAALRYAKAHGGTGSATIVGSSLTTGPVDAALANGVMAHADETDDSHSLSQSHPGCAVVPAALAAGETFGIDGARFLRAVTLGYDIGTRVTMAMGGVTFRNESHRSTHSIAGVFGAAAAAACAAGLDARQMRWMLDYTAQQSSGIAAWQRDTDHIEKAFVFGGMSARNGVTSALVVQSGWNGVDDIFSGADNFFLAYAPAAEPARLVEQLGERHEITRTDIKKWTVGSPIQAPLDAVEILRERHPFDADGVQRVVVRLAPTVAAVVDNRDIPDICLQHMVAVMLLDKTVSFKAAHDKARMRDEAVLRQRAKVQLVGDEALQRLMPVRVAVVELTLGDGTRLTERVEAVRGTPRNPMSRAEVVNKCRGLISPVIGAEKSTRLIDTLLAIEKVSNVRTLRPLLQRT